MAQSNFLAFQKLIWSYYKKHGRHDLPWRLTRDPYKILVSEIMLQQTQVARVSIKYKSFLERFPTVQKLAEANLGDVLKKWQGLGYNRRAVYLKKCAEVITKEHKGKFPKNLKELLELPGIGKATAGDLLAFAWDLPAIVIETNIRTVFIHHLFGNKEKVSDKEIEALVEKTLPKKNVREWYYALMDYGSFLKETTKHNSRSSHYVKQSTFKGSNREKRSAILKLILEKPRTNKELEKITTFDLETILKNLEAMQKEGLIHKKGSKMYA